MSIVTIILLIALAVLITIKPTYVAIYAENEEGHEGTYFGCCPLVVALRFKIQFPYDVMILSGREYDRVADFFMRLEEKEN